MTIALFEPAIDNPGTTLFTRRQFSALLAENCREANAAFYMVLETGPDEEGPSPRILASNWVYDLIRDIGTEGLAHLGESTVASFTGQSPRGWHPAALAALLDRPELSRLAEHGHAEVFSLKIPAGTRRSLALVSAHRAGVADAAAIARLQMTASYALSHLDHAPAGCDPLSDRERECLFWVSEGKTSDEVALILDVSANTVNSYVAHAIHKLGARNRAMAIAAAIRRGII